jgi:hypothetical protein
MKEKSINFVLRGYLLDFLPRVILSAWKVSKLIDDFDVMRKFVDDANWSKLTMLPMPINDIRINILRDINDNWIYLIKNDYTLSYAFDVEEFKNGLMVVIKKYERECQQKQS